MARKITTFDRAERHISAATSILLCALTVVAQIATVLLLVKVLQEKASFVYGVLQLVGVIVAIRVYQRPGSPNYKLSWMCLLLILPVAGLILFWVWGGAHQAKRLSLKTIPPIPQRESQKMSSETNLSRLQKGLLLGEESQSICKNEDFGFTRIQLRRIFRMAGPFLTT